MKQLFLAIVLGIIGFAAYLFYYLGAFKGVEISETSAGPMKMIYTEHIGAYSTIVGNIEKVEKWAKANNIDCTESFGEYLDNPDIVEPERLRSHAGCIVKEIPTSLPEGFKSQELPLKKYVKAVFTGAPSIGPFKVYPKAQKYMDEHQLALKGGVIEIYVILGPKEMNTSFLFPIE